MGDRRLKALVGCLLLLGACSLPAAKDDGQSATDAYAVADEDTCTPVSPQQRPRVAAALQVLNTFHDYDAVYEGAMEFFGYRRSLEDPEPFCLDEDLKREITAATLNAKAWERGLAGSAKLNLARQLGPRDERIVRYVARTAFHDRPVADIAFADVRPHARSVLASFGVAALPWRDEALATMNAKDSLGTSSAQVAAASRDGRTLAAVARLLETELGDGAGVIRRQRANRTVELAYALGAAGEAARPYTGLLVRLLGRQVEDAAPPFGIIERAPSEVCRALVRIGGSEAERAIRSRPCAERPWSLIPD